MRSSIQKVSQESSFETYVHFLPPGIHPQYYKFTRYIQTPPFEEYPSYGAAVRKVDSFSPDAILRNVRIGYTVASLKYHPKQKDPYRVSEATTFSHSEINVDTFQRLLKCCDPQHNNSLEQTKDCWNRIFPNSLSSFNLNVSDEKDLLPGVRENLQEHYPPSQKK